MAGVLSGMFAELGSVVCELSSWISGLAVTAGGLAQADNRKVKTVKTIGTLGIMSMK
jgi:hypothetical protein